MTLLLEMFSYPFILRAFIVGILVSLCASLLGVSLVLKRYSMIGDGLSHVSFGALAIALACGWAPLQFSIWSKSRFLYAALARSGGVGPPAIFPALVEPSASR